MQPSRGAILAITLGDPAGVGPEVALRAARALLARGAARVATTTRRAPATRVVLIGDLDATRETAARLRVGVTIEPCEPSEIASVDATAAARRGLVLPLIAPDPVLARQLRVRERRPGAPSVAGARTAYASIRRAVDLATAGAIDAICTAPISKEWFDRAGVASTGHTEILAELSGARQVRLMMAHPRLRIVLATTHLALRDVPRALTIEGLVDTIAVTADHLRRWFGVARPRVAVAALNPHASDGGVYGDEEARLIAPAIRRARARRIDAFGPVPADTLFSALGPRCDAAVTMYHDQGLIPVKQLGVHEAVNVTLGLPFVRTSPDHGTAYDVARAGGADPRSMQAALGLALELADIERRAARRPVAASRRASSPQAPAA